MVSIGDVDPRVLGVCPALTHTVFLAEVQTERGRREQAPGAQSCVQEVSYETNGVGLPKHPAPGRQDRKGVCAQMITITSLSCEGNSGSD